MTTKQELSDMTDQQLNIKLATKLGIKWVIRPEDNVDEPWAWRFSDLGQSVTPLPDYVGGCKELCDLIVKYEVTIGPLESSSTWYASSELHEYAGIGNSNPWRAVVEYLLLEVDL